MGNITNKFNKNIRWLYENTKSDLIKQTIEEAGIDITKYNLDSDIANQIAHKKISGIAHPDIDMYESYHNTMNRLSNMGISKSLTELMGKKPLLESLDIFDIINEIYVGKKYDFLPDYRLIGRLLESIDQYSDIGEILSIYNELSQKFTDDKPYIIIQNCIDDLCDDPHSYLYDKLICRLNFSMHLPPFQCYAYVYKEVVKHKDNHESICLLYDQMHNKLGSYDKHMISHTKGYADIVLESKNVTHHVSLIYNDNKNKYIRIGNSYFDLINNMEIINETLIPYKYAEDSSINNKISWSDNKILHKSTGISISEHKDKVYIQIDEDKFEYKNASKLSDDLFFTNTPKNFHRDIIFIVENYKNFVVTENILKMDGDHNDNKVFVIDKGSSVDVLESISNEPNDAIHKNLKKSGFINQMKMKHEIDLSEKLNYTNSFSNNKKNTKRQKSIQLEKIIKNINDINESIRYIDSQDTSIKSDPDMVVYYGKLQENLSVAKTKKLELEKELGI